MGRIISKVILKRFSKLNHRSNLTILELTERQTIKDRKGVKQSGTKREMERRKNKVRKKKTDREIDTERT